MRPWNPYNTHEWRSTYAGKHCSVTYSVNSQSEQQAKIAHNCGFACNHGGGITRTCGRPVFWRIGKSSPKRVRRTAPPPPYRRRRRRVGAKPALQTPGRTGRPFVRPGTAPRCPETNFSAY